MERLNKTLWAEGHALQAWPGSTVRWSPRATDLELLAPTVSARCRCHAALEPQLQRCLEGLWRLRLDKRPTNFRALRDRGLAHSAVVTAAHVHDKHPLPGLLHGQEERVYGDCAYAAQQDLIRAKAPGAANFTSKTVRKGSVTEGLERLVNRAK